MLVACRLAGLSALETYYAGVRAPAQCGPTRSPIASLGLAFRAAAPSLAGRRQGASFQHTPGLPSTGLSFGWVPEGGRAGLSACRRANLTSPRMRRSPRRRERSHYFFEGQALRGSD